MQRVTQGNDEQVDVKGQQRNVRGNVKGKGQMKGHNPEVVGMEG